MITRPPWYVWTALAAVTCILVGTYWDISWHMSIGRDSFWTPAHIVIQLGGIIAGIAGTYLILSTTFGRTAPLREASIGVWGFRGPFGAFLAVWGGATMLVSAPFDNWWHGAYGLDVKILSPPHMVLSLGILAVATGSVLLVLATVNRSTGSARRRLEWILLVVGGEILSLSMIAILEITFRSNLHRAESYRTISLVVPILVLAVARASDRRWATTTIAATYTLFMVAMVWLFPLIPAEPKLGPVYQPITHLVPLEFPLLVIVPAIAIDLLRDRMRAWARWKQAIAIGVVFVATLVVVEWPFASFLQSPASHNRIFGTHYYPYFLGPDTYTVRGEFMPANGLVQGFAVTLAVAMIASGIGILLGDAMRKVRR